jgi:hypothetical protein
MTENMMYVMSPKKVTIDSAKESIKTAIPDTAKVVSKFLVASGKAFVDTSEGVGNTATGSLPAFDKVKESGKKIASGLVDVGAAGFSMAEEIDKLLDKGLGVFRISIGKYFIHSDMIIRNFTASYSRELDEDGDPLYADYTFEVESREVLTQDDIEGIFGGSRGSRVTITQGGGDGGGESRAFMDIGRENM